MQVKKKMVDEVKPVQVDGVGEQKVEKILNKKKIRDIIKYIVQWKVFMMEHNMQKKEEDLENAKEKVTEFKRRLSTEVII